MLTHIYEKQGVSEQLSKVLLVYQLLKDKSTDDTLPNDLLPFISRYFQTYIMQYARLKTSLDNILHSHRYKIGSKHKER